MSRLLALLLGALLGTESEGVVVTLYVWVRSGHRPPEGFIYSGVVSVWPDTGAVRAELWERSE